LARASNGAPHGGENAAVEAGRPGSEQGAHELLGRVARLVRVARAVERRDRLGERLRCLAEPCVAH